MMYLLTTLELKRSSEHNSRKSMQVTDLAQRYSLVPRPSHETGIGLTPMEVLCHLTQDSHKILHCGTPLLFSDAVCMPRRGHTEAKRVIDLARFSYERRLRIRL